MGLLFLILLIADILSFAAVEVVLSRRWDGAWRLAALLPGVLFIGAILNIIVAVSFDKTAHNLWPMELLMWSAGGLAYLGLLFLIHKAATK